MYIGMWYANRQGKGEREGELPSPLSLSVCLAGYGGSCGLEYSMLRSVIVARSGAIYIARD